MASTKLPLLAEESGVPDNLVSHLCTCEMRGMRSMIRALDGERRPKYCCGKLDTRQPNTESSCSAISDATLRGMNVHLEKLRVRLVIVVKMSSKYSSTWHNNKGTRGCLVDTVVTNGEDEALENIRN